MSRFVSEVQDISSEFSREVQEYGLQTDFGLQRCVKGKITVQFVDRLLTASMLDISDLNGGGD